MTWGKWVNFMVSWTPADEAAYHARKLAKAEAHTEARGCEVEKELHEAISRECLRRGWLAFHGSMTHKTFRTEGEPDFVILCDDGKVLLVECKTRKGKLSPEQLGVHAWAKRLGHEVHTIRSMEEFYALTLKPPYERRPSEHHQCRD